MTKAQKALIDAMPAGGYFVTLWGDSIFSSNLPKGARLASIEALVSAGVLKATRQDSMTTRYVRT